MAAGQANHVLNPAAAFPVHVLQRIAKEKTRLRSVRTLCLLKVDFIKQWIIIRRLKNHILIQRINKILYQFLHEEVLYTNSQHVDFIVLDVFNQTLVDDCNFLQKPLENFLEMQKSEEKPTSKGLENCTSIYTLVQGSSKFIENTIENWSCGHFTDTIPFVFEHEILDNPFSQDLAI